MRVACSSPRCTGPSATQSTARHLLREIDDILLHRPALGALVDQVSEFREILTASAQVGAAGGSPLTPAELRLLPYLQTHLTFREIGERLFVSRNTVSSEVGSIYRKLGVSSRADAVDQATARACRRLAHGRALLARHRDSEPLLGVDEVVVVVCPSRAGPMDLPVKRLPWAV